MLRFLQLTAGLLALVLLAVTPAGATDACYPSPKGEPCKVLFKDVGGGKLAPAQVTVDAAGAAVSPATAANQASANTRLDTLISQTAPNTTVTAMTLTGATSNQNGADQTNLYYRGTVCFVNISSITGSVIISIRNKDSVSGGIVSLLSSASISTTGTTIMYVYPGMTATANSKQDALLARTWNLNANVTTGPVTGTVACDLIR